MSRKPANLPNIEDATLEACLAPLTTPVKARDALRDPMPASSTAQVVTIESVNSAIHPPHEFTRVPATLDEWRSLADQQFAAFGTVEQMASRTDEELLSAVLVFPRQISSFLARASEIECRLTLQRHAITTLMVRLRMAMTRAAAGSGTAGAPLSNRGRQA